MYTLERAHERQREIACEIDARRSVAVPAPALETVACTWLTALRTTSAYLRAVSNGRRASR
jgi:hypothetical protein